MALTFGGVPNSFMKNAFIDEIEVLEARDISGIENQWGNVPDLAIEIEYPGREGTSYKQTIGGNFKRNGEEVVGWGGAFPLQNLIERSEMFKALSHQEKSELLEILSIGKVPQKFLRFLKGKILHKISFVKGYKEDDPTKLAYSTFNQLGWDREYLIQTFKRGLLKGYPKNYNPDAIAGPIDPDFEPGDTSFDIPIEDDDVI